MIRKHASLIIALSLIALVATACIIRSRPPGQRAQPVYVEKHKKPKKQKEDHEDHGKHKGQDKH